MEDIGLSSCIWVSYIGNEIRKTLFYTHEVESILYVFTCDCAHRQDRRELIGYFNHSLFVFSMDFEGYINWLFGGQV